MITATRTKSGIKTILNIYPDKTWTKAKYNKEGKTIGFENSYGFWEKWAYDQNGEQISYNNSDGKLVVK